MAQLISSSGPVQITRYVVKRNLMPDKAKTARSCALRAIPVSPGKRPNGTNSCPSPQPAASARLFMGRALAFLSDRRYRAHLGTIKVF